MTSVVEALIPREKKEIIAIIFSLHWQLKMCTFKFNYDECLNNLFITYRS